MSKTAKGDKPKDIRSITYLFVLVLYIHCCVQARLSCASLSPVVAETDLQSSPKTAMLVSAPIPSPLPVYKTNKYCDFGIEDLDILHI